MSRFRSPQVAAKRTERAAKEAEQRRKESRKSRWMIIGLAVVSIFLMVGDYFWLKARAQKRREEHMRTRHRPTQTNDAVHVTKPGSTNSSQIP